MVERIFDMNPGEQSAYPVVLTTNLIVSPPDLILKTSTSFHPSGLQFLHLPTENLN